MNNIQEIVCFQRANFKGRFLKNMFQRIEKPIITLPSSHPALVDFMPARREVTNGTWGLNPLCRVTGVGMIYDYPSCYGRLYERDKAWLRHTINYCDKNELHISADYSLTPLNLVHGQDFLNIHPPIPTDILMVCFVPDRASEAAREWRNSKVNDIGTLTSIHHTEDSWHGAASNSDTKLIVCFRGEGRDEIRGFHFNRSKDHVFVETLPVIAPTIIGSSEYLMEVFVSCDYAEAIARKAPSSVLGRKLLTLAV